MRGSAGWSLPRAASDSRCALPAVEEASAAGPLRGQRKGLCGRPCPAPCPVPSRPPLARCPRGGGLSAFLRHSSPHCRHEARRGSDAGLWFQCAWIGASLVIGKSWSAPELLSDAGVRVCRGGRAWECGLCCRRWGLRVGIRDGPRHRGGPRRSERGGVGSPALRVSEKHPTTLSTRGARPATSPRRHSHVRVQPAQPAGALGGPAGHWASVLFPSQRT